MLPIPTPEKFTSTTTDESNFSCLTQDLGFSYLSFPYHKIKFPPQSSKSNGLDYQLDLQLGRYLLSSDKFPYIFQNRGRIKHLEIKYRDTSRIASKFNYKSLDNYKVKLLEENIYSKLQNIIEQNNITEQIYAALDLKIKLENPISTVTNESNFQITQNRLIELLQEDDEDDDGWLKPTNYAFDKAWNLLQNVSEIMKENFPKAWVSTDEKGGIRFTWSKLEAEAEIRLICGATPESQTYIYHEQGSEYDVVKQLSASSLAHWLKWLNQV